jgi:hypothetical protein
MVMLRQTHLTHDPPLSPISIDAHRRESNS